MRRITAAGIAITTAFWILTALSSAHCAAPASTFVNASHPAVRYIGRFDRRHPRHVRFDWPGAAVETRFEGSSCAALLRGDGGLYDVSVDGALTVRRFDTLETTHTLASGLADSIHSLRIVKRSEGLRGQVVTLKGFYLNAGKKLLPPLTAMPKRRIEFIGGSNVLGFGVEADTVWCDTPGNYSNISLSFGAVTAKAVGAEYRVLAVSGKGLVRNWRSPYIAATHPFEPLYRLAVKNDPSAVWDFKSWVPHVVAVCFGTNDFSTRPYPTKTLFVESYKRFLDDVWARYPNAQIVCVTSAREPVRTYVREMVKAEREVGNGRIHFYSFGEVPKRECGCDWHPNAGAQNRIGRELAEIVRPLF
jgi:hypothetical protein